MNAVQRDVPKIDLMQGFRTTCVLVAILHNILKRHLIRLLTNVIQEVSH
jgi:hypothetical protein